MRDINELQSRAKLVEEKRKLLESKMRKNETDTEHRHTIEVFRNTHTENPSLRKEGDEDILNELAQLCTSTVEHSQPELTQIDPSLAHVSLPGPAPVRELYCDVTHFLTSLHSSLEAMLPEAVR